MILSVSFELNPTFCTTGQFQRLQSKLHRQRSDTTQSTVGYVQESQHGSQHMKGWVP